MKRLFASFFFLAFAGASPTSAMAEQLTGSELRDLLAGETINLSAPFGSLPITYSPAGRMVAKSAVMAVFSGIYKDTGTWRINGNSFCQKWKTWNGGREQCFSVRRKGQTLHWKSNDGMSGTAYAAN